MAPLIFQRIRRIFRGRFFRNVSILLSGNVIAQVILLASAPVLSRVYTPEQFGFYGVFAALVVTIGVLATWKYEQAILLPRTTLNAAEIFVLCCVLSVAASATSAIAVAAFGGYLGSLVGLSQAPLIIYLLPIAILVVGLSHTVSFWATREGQFKEISRSRISQASGMVGAQLLGGIGGIGAIGLAAGKILGDAVVAVRLALGSWEGLKQQLHEAVRAPGICMAAREYREFPLFGAPKAFLNSLSQNVPMLMLTFVFSPQIGGLYYLAHRMLSIPTNLVSQSIKNVFLQHGASKLHEGRSLDIMLRKYTLRLVAVALIPVAIFFAIGPHMFTIVFGPEWATAGDFARWIVLLSFFGFVNTPAVAGIVLLRLQGIFLFYEVLLFAARIAAISIGWALHDALLAVILVVAVGVAFNASLIVIVYSVARKRNMEVNRSFESP